MPINPSKVWGAPAAPGQVPVGKDAPFANVSSADLRIRQEAEKSWQTLLPLVGPDTFTENFAFFHAEHWDAYWTGLQKLKAGMPLDEDEMVLIEAWGRGMGKSSTVEWSAIIEGMILGEGYVLYISGTQDLATRHVQAIGARLESPNILRFYPGLGEPKMTIRKTTTAWRQNFLHTRCGWGIAAVGLDQGVRGGKVGDQRPSLIVFDDVDDRGDSIEAVNKKIDIVARSVIPTGGKRTRILFAQNLIHKNSLLSQVLNPKQERARILQRRKVFGPYPALVDEKIVRKGTVDVLERGTPLWPHFDMDACQKFLADAGRLAFEAEYLNKLDGDDSEIIIPEWDELVHVITWSEFSAVYKALGIPAHWEKDVGLDWGSSGLEQHPTCLSGVTTAAEDSKLPGFHFLYFGLAFDTGVLVGNVAESLRSVFGQVRIHEDVRIPEEVDCSGIRRMRMSHEAKSQRDTFRQLYNIPFLAGKSGKTDGIEMLRHYLQVNYSEPHPFKPGKKGLCLFYWIVDDDQLEIAVNDRGLKRHREEIKDWRWRVTKINDSGINEQQPVKFRDDAMDSLRMITQNWLPPPAELTASQRLEKALPASLRADQMPSDPAKQDGWFLRRAMEMGNAKKKVHREGRSRHFLDDEVPSPWQEEEWDRLESERLM